MRLKKTIAVASAICGAVALWAPSIGATASAAPVVKCTSAQYNRGVCLVAMVAPGTSPLTSAVQAAIRSGRADVVDKFEKRLPAGAAGDSQRDEINTARTNVPQAVYASPEAGEGTITRGPKPGTVSPRGGSDGTGVGYVWNFHDERPIVRITSGGSELVDTIDINFHLNLFQLNTAQLNGDFTARNGVGKFGVKNFTCQVKMDRDFLPDPVRGSFSGCQGVPRASRLQVLDSDVSHTYYDEPNWVDIKFESYDADKGVSFGTLEYKSPNWKKTASGDQYFP